jgi:hypothetical protein
MTKNKKYKNFGKIIKQINGPVIPTTCTAACLEIVTTTTTTTTAAAAAAASRIPHGWICLTSSVNVETEI